MCWTEEIHYLGRRHAEPCGHRVKQGSHRCMRARLQIGSRLFGWTPSHRYVRRHGKLFCARREPVTQRVRGLCPDCDLRWRTLRGPYYSSATPPPPPRRPPLRPHHRAARGRRAARGGRAPRPRPRGPRGPRPHPAGPAAGRAAPARPPPRRGARGSSYPTGARGHSRAGAAQGGGAAAGRGAATTCYAAAGVVLGEQPPPGRQSGPAEGGPEHRACAAVL